MNIRMYEFRNQATQNLLKPALSSFVSDKSITFQDIFSHIDSVIDREVSVLKLAGLEYYNEDDATFLNTLCHAILMDILAFEFGTIAGLNPDSDEFKYTLFRLVRGYLAFGYLILCNVSVAQYIEQSPEDVIEYLSQGFKLTRRRNDWINPMFMYDLIILSISTCRQYAIETKSQLGCLLTQVITQI